jgi:glycosyltransferase involved in cell wall biosynthesis
MIRLFVNALAASAGGGLTYVRNLIPELERRSDVSTTVLLPAALRAEFAPSANVDFCECTPKRGFGRYWSEQTLLPRIITKSGANILLSTGNFALWRSPVPQILLSRNALYLSQDFYRDLRQRRDLRLWLDTRIKGALARRSIRTADCTIAPTSAFAADLACWVDKPVRGLHHGFDAEHFFRDNNSLPLDTRQQLEHAEGCLKLLFVSHYNYYRNFETLLRALPLLRDRLAPRHVRLVLTCKLESGANPGAYKADGAANLARQLRVETLVIQLGAVPYRALHHVYRACDVYVTPAYAESFAHPLVEAMASGLPVVASDIAVHREICGGAARYFQSHSPEDAASAICETIDSSEVRSQQCEIGRLRAEEFSWRKHVDALLEQAGALL